MRCLPATASTLPAAKAVGKVHAGRVKTPVVGGPAGFSTPNGGAGNAAPNASAPATASVTKADERIATDDRVGSFSSSLSKVNLSNLWWPKSSSGELPLRQQQQLS